MINTHYFVAPLEDKDALINTCLENHAECHWHTIPDDHKIVLFLLIRPKVSMYLDCHDKYLSFPDLSDRQTPISKELLAAFPLAVGLTEQDNTFSALQKIHTALGMAAMHPHR